MAETKKDLNFNPALNLYFREISQIPLLSPDEFNFYMSIVRDYLQKNPKVLAAEEVVETGQRKITPKTLKFRKRFQGFEGVLPTYSSLPLSDNERTFAIRYLDELLHRREDYSAIVKPTSPEVARQLSLGLPTEEHRYSAAFSKLWSSNLRLVVPFAKKRDRRLSLEEKISLGNTGLRRAILKFDLSKNCVFSTYAVRWIRQHIQRGISEELNLIRTPPKSNYVPLMPPTSIDVAVNEDGKPILEALYDPRLDSPLNGLIDTENREILSRLLSNGILKKREKEILSSLYGLRGSSNPTESKTLEEVARGLGLSRERIRQIKKKVIKKLRKEFDRITK